MYLQTQIWNIAYHLSSIQKHQQNFDLSRVLFLFFLVIPSYLSFLLFDTPHHIFLVGKMQAGDEQNKINSLFGGHSQSDFQVSDSWLRGTPSILGILAWVGFFKGRNIRTNHSQKHKSKRYFLSLRQSTKETVVHRQYWLWDAHNEFFGSRGYFLLVSNAKSVVVMFDYERNKWEKTGFIEIGKETQWE
jgi:hypothetical protein